MHHFLGISLCAGVTPRHLVAYLFVALISSGYAGLLAMLEPGLLQELQIPYEDQGPITGNLRVLQEIIFIMMLGLYGALADRIGRRLIYAFGLSLTALGYILYPFAESLSQLVLFRVIIAFGGAAVIGMMVTVIADYSEDISRGKANGLQGLVATFGAFIPPILGFMPSQFVAQGFSQSQALQLTFAIAGALGTIGALIAWFGLSPSAGTQLNSKKEKLLASMKIGLAEARDPRILLSYGAAFISRGDLAVTGAFMGLWLVQWAKIEMGMDTSQAMSEIAAPRIFATVGGAFIGALLMGYISDRVDRVMAVSMASGLAAFIYLSVYFVSDPTAPWVLILLFVMGIAEIAAFVSSQALVGRYASEQRRGAVFGFFGVAGAFGILVGSGGGGWLFKHIGPSAPFVLFGMLNML
ncbi:MAG: MFS transporter, partial [Pseudomonadales bacterium]